MIKECPTRELPPKNTARAHIPDLFVPAYPLPHLLPQQALRECNQLSLAAVGTPRHAAICEHAQDHAARRAAKHAIAGLEVSGFTKTMDDFNHYPPIEHPGDIVGDRGHKPRGVC